MDAPKYQKTDPAVLLLNEIDILQTQTRLMELYLKQAQAAAADENARLHEKYEAELANLRAALDANERERHERSVINTSVEQLQRELSEKQNSQTQHEAALQSSRSEIIALQNRIADIEAEHSAAVSALREANAIRDSLSADVAALNQELANNRREFHQQQQAGRDIESGLRDQLQRLQNQVVENQAIGAGSADELRKAQQEIAALRQHLQSLEAIQDDLQANAARELEHARGRFENELASLRANLLAERDRAVGDSQAALANIELALKNEIALLRGELEQKQAALTARDDDLRAAEMHIAALQQRVTDLDLAHRQATAASAEIDSMRRSLADEVANLQHQVEVKENELTNRYEAVTAVELALHGRIQALQQELAHAQDASSAYEGELEKQRAQSAALQNRIVELERTQADAGALETTRQQLESDLNRLRADLAQKEYLIAGQERALANLENHSVAEVAALREQLEQERASVAIQSEQLSVQIKDLQLQLVERDRSSADLEARLSEEITKLQQQLARERSNSAIVTSDLDRARGELAGRSEAVEAELRQKDEEIATLRGAASGQTEQLADRINALQFQLAEKQLLADSRASELANQRTIVTQLHEQLSENTEHHTQLLTRWQNAEAQLNNEIAQSSAAREELAREQTALEVQLNQARGANADLRVELQEAKNRTAELAALLQSNEAAMAVVGSDRARLRSSLEELSALHGESKADAARDLAEARRALESELTALRGELQQKSWSLAQQQASVENLAHIHREQIRKLEARLVENQRDHERQTSELQQALGRTDALQQQVEDLQAELQRIHSGEASQTEQIRQEYAARLESANALLAAQSAELAKSGAARADIEASLRTEITRLNDEMQVRTTALQSREDELERVRAEMTSVQNRIVQFESITARTESEAREIHQAKSALEADFSALRHELQQKSSAVAQQQAAMDELAARYREQVEQLEASLREYQNSSEERRREIDQAQAQIAFLKDRVAQLQSALEETELTANSRTEQVRQEYEMRLEAVSRELAASSTQLHERIEMTSDRDQALRGEIDRLVSEAQERNLILQNRNDELVRVKSELDSLSERFTQLEANAIQAESSASGDAERMRTEYQAQLALLQAELSQKEWALEERQAIIAGIEQEHRHEIDALRQQLAVKQFTAGPDEGAFVVGDLTDTRPEKWDKFDDMVKAIRNGNNHDHSMPPPRRWHSGFGWKRRWRS